MCGRYTLYSDPDFLNNHFDLENPEEAITYKPRYNIAPSQDILAVVQGKKGQRAGFMKWGLVPSWADEPSIGYKMINARSETIHEKPSFKHLINRRRCIVCASGFYEWKKEGGRKQPYYIQLPSEQPMMFAGLWDRWEKEGQTLITTTILTTEANSTMKELHHRMPVILNDGRQKHWLDVNSKDTLHKIYKERPSSLHIHPVSMFVNSPQNEGPECIERI
ncbi:SOS response-associated peptidase [Bacillus sp. H-16]|uniref:SOS response-associated peptidase n=1 Tax=Alteribacter salitolerans TaxID=2912333 RepID=UPI00196305FF|nr:SOS response-associated peptidase [Alteribacter salitolerans]MBM7094535.1 SOS response-associated peptidase [Alteribacter salitolerans]